MQELSRESMFRKELSDMLNYYEIEFFSFIAIREKDTCFGCLVSDNEQCNIAKASVEVERETSLLKESYSLFKTLLEAQLKNK